MDHNLVPPFIMRQAGLEVDEQAKIHTLQPSKENYSVYSKDINLRIPLKIEGIFRCLKRGNSIQLRSPKLGSMILYSSRQMQIPGTQMVKLGGGQEDLMLDQDGDIIQYEVKKPVEIIEESDYFGMSSMEAIGVSKENYESYIDALISPAYSSIPEPGDVTDSHRVQDWLLMEDGIRAHVASTNARLD